MPTLTQLLQPLAEVDDRGICGDDGSYSSWRQHIQDGADLAALLRARLDPNRPPHVGVLLGNTPQFSGLLVAAALGRVVLVGLNPTRRGAALLRDASHADCQFVLTEQPYGTDFPADGIPALDMYGAAWSEEIAEFAGSPITFPDSVPDDLLMLIFTSGTSGDPKAVRCTHEKVAGPGVMLAQRFGLGSSDVFYLSMPLFHSNAVMAGWAPAVAAQGSIALRRRFSASGFIDDVRRFGATYANYVGKPMSYILATPERPDDAENPLRIMYGNEAAPRDIVRFAERFAVTVVDGFGSSEGGVSIARTRETPEGSLGPLPEDLAVLDVDTGQRCSPGVVGELVNVNGPGQFRGYYKDPDAEAERMAGGVYHSGDLAYLDDAGFVYFAGRLGDWMRVDGENLGTAPIERILMRYPGVVEVAVYGIPDPEVGDRVMAAVVLAKGVSFDAPAFRRFLSDQSDLGPKQWPSFVRVAGSLPKTATFKVLKRRLSEQALDCRDPVFEV
ncbi:MAG: long-chain-fatty-acid--CoA ligase FadD17 [Mycobacterium sp.]|nr:long-chain-fatty-acid--CoA ligase FadD17 [Mycobacterium sp.]